MCVCVCGKPRHARWQCALMNIHERVTWSTLPLLCCRHTGLKIAATCDFRHVCHKKKTGIYDDHRKALCISTWSRCIRSFIRHRMVAVTNTGLPLSRQKKIPTFLDKIAGNVCRTNAHLLIKISREHHVWKMNYSTNKVQVSDCWAVTINFPWLHKFSWPSIPDFYPTLAEFLTFPCLHKTRKSVTLQTYN